MMSVVEFAKPKIGDWGMELKRGELVRMNDAAEIEQDRIRGQWREYQYPKQYKALDERRIKQLDDAIKANKSEIKEIDAYLEGLNEPQV